MLSGVCQRCSGRAALGESGVFVAYLFKASERKSWLSDSIERFERAELHRK